MQLYYAYKMEGDRAYGDEVEARHLSKVMRKEVGDLAFVTHGDGTIWEAEILTMGRSSVTFKTLRVATEISQSGRLAIAVAPTKSASRIEDLVEKGVELGLTDLFLIKTQRTLRKDFKTKRLNRLVISALKQSHRSHLTKVHEMVSYGDFLRTAADEFSQRFIGKIEGENGFLIKEKVNEDVVVLIGPEGDFTDEEYELAANAEFVPVKLSKQRLRTETAGIMSIATIQNKRNSNE